MVDPLGEALLTSSFTEDRIEVYHLVRLSVDSLVSLRHEVLEDRHVDLDVILLCRHDVQVRLRFSGKRHELLEVCILDQGILRAARALFCEDREVGVELCFDAGHDISNLLSVKDRGGRFSVAIRR